MILRRQFSTTNGFTALEVVVATTLASLMMIAVLGVLAGIAKKEQLLADRADVSPSWQRQFLTSLRRDLESSSTFRADETTVVLTGFGGRRNGVPTWEPVETHYWIVQAGDRSALMRQVHPLIQPGRPFNPEIVCLGVDKFLLRADGQEQPPDAETQSPSDLELPRRVLVQLLRGERIILEATMRR